jgi:hypothetical protein
MHQDKQKRALFNDGLFSLAHFVAGMIVGFVPMYSLPLIMGFVLYQTSDYLQKNENIVYDTTEFLLGYLTIKILQY